MCKSEIRVNADLVLKSNDVSVPGPRTEVYIERQQHCTRLMFCTIESMSQLKINKLKAEFADLYPTARTDVYENLDGYLCFKVYKK